MHRVKQQRGRWVVPVLVAATFVLAFALPALAAADFQLTIETTGTGTGTVQCEVEGGPVEACDAEYPEGTELALIPEAGPSSEFIEFSGDCGPLACELLMDEAHTAIATFDLEPGAVEYPLTIVKAGSGSGTVQCEVESGPIGTCAAEYPEGTELSVLAEADLGSNFAGFSGACTGSSCDLTMSAAKSVTATFDLEAAPEFALTVTKAGSGTGTVLCEAAEGPEACKVKYPEGTEVTLLPTAGAGSNFAGFSGACTGPTCELTMDAAKSVTATFNSEATPEFALTVTNAGTGSGTVKCKVGAGSPGACAAKYSEGTELMLIAEASAGSEFAGFSSGTGSASACSTSPCSFTITANSSVTATFNLIQRTLSVTTAGTGTGEVKCKFNGGSAGACTSPQPNGTSVEIIATANAGSTFAGFSSGTGSASACSTSPCSFTITANSSVTATFNLVPPAESTLTITKAGTGAGEVKCKFNGGSAGACTSPQPNGTSVEIIATANAGSEFAGFSAGTGSAAGCSTSPCSFTLNANSAVTATFNLVPPAESTLTITKAGTGTGTVQCKFNGGSAGACTSPQPNGTTVEIIATANAGSTFAGFSSGTGSASSCSTSPCSFTLNANSSVTATFNLIQRTLSVTTAGTGTGTIQCKFNGGSAGACTSPQPNGTTVEIIATANAGSTFAGFSSGTGSASSCSTSPCSFTITANSSVTATFNPISRTLSVTTAGTGAGTVQCKFNGGSAGACTSPQPNGTSVEIIATANAGSTFAGFSSGTGSASSCSTSPCSFTITANSSVTATFNLVPPAESTLTVTTAGTGTGTIQCKFNGGSAGACTSPQPNGTTVEIIATANAGSTFAGFSSGTGSAASCSTSPCSFTLNANSAVTATFNPISRTLSVTTAGTGAGTVQCKFNGGSAGACTSPQPNGTSVEIIATANAGSTFAGFSSGTGSAGSCSTSPCSFTITANSSVTATFNPISRTLSVTTAGTGAGTVQCKFNGGSAGACTSPQPNGTTVQIIATPNASSTFAGFSGGTGSASSCSTSPCSFTITANSSVTATFNLKPVVVEYALAIEKIGTGTGTVTSSPAGIDCGSDCEASFADDTKVTLTATPDEGSAFDHWTGSGCNKGTCVVAMTRVRTIKAVFDAVGERTLTVVKAGTGSGTVTSAPKGIDCGSVCSAGFDVGKKITVFAAEAAGSTFTGFSGACTGTGNCKVTMDEARSVTATFEAAPGGQSSVGLAVVGGNAKIKNGRALVKVLCNGPSPCKGELKLGLRIPANGGQAKRTVVIGKGFFGLQPGASTTLRIKLSRRALGELEGRTALGARVAGTGIHPHALRLKNV